MPTAYHCPCGRILDVTRTSFGTSPMFCPSCLQRVILPEIPREQELPKPLSDPLRGFRKFLGWVMIIQLVAAVVFPLLIVPRLRGPGFEPPAGPDIDRIFAG